jgi:cell division protein FtsZ
VVIGTVLDPDMQDEVRVTVVATGLNRAVSRQALPARGERFERDHGEPQRRPHVQLINTQSSMGKRDGTTGMLIDEVADPYAPGQSLASGLRGRSSESAAPAVADFGGDSSYLDIPAFLRRQAD